MLQNLLLISCWVCNVLQIKEHSQKLTHYLFQNDVDSRKIGTPGKSWKRGRYVLNLHIKLLILM